MSQVIYEKRQNDGTEMQNKSQISQIRGASAIYAAIGAIVIGGLLVSLGVGIKQREALGLFLGGYFLAVITVSGMVMAVFVWSCRVMRQLLWTGAEMTKISIFLVACVSASVGILTILGLYSVFTFNYLAVYQNITAWALMWFWIYLIYWFMISLYQDASSSGLIKKSINR
jgi:hypothetical protein